ncbi:MAG: TonB-dependent hemoglobin/transferrin/lactoferrin family receptor [Alphaproteobacteria bacterium]|nr:TonB-dependent hemoglobin/transferrin/lactoferrin family receptor [Alphaproteobacteria bacterium]
MTEPTTAPPRMRVLSTTALAGAMLVMTATAAQSQDADRDQGAVTSLDAMTVTATRTEKSAIEAPASVSVVDREAILQAQPQSLDDVLKGVPGVQMTGGPRNTAEQPNIRGFSDERVVVITDGVRKNFQSGHRGRTFLDPTLLKSVDVLRGPSSMLYGSGALGGVLSIETIDASDLLKPGEKVGLRTSIGGQSNNAYKSANVTAFGTPLDGVDLLFSASRHTSGNYEDGDGQDIPFSADDIGSALAKGSVEHEGHEVELNLQLFRDDHEIPTAANTNGTVIADRVTREESGSLRYGYNDMEGLLDLTVTAYSNNAFIREIVQTSGRHDVTKLDTLGIDVANTSRTTLSEDAKLALTYGFELYQDDQEGVRNDAPRGQYPNASQITQGYFAQAEFTLWDDLTVIPGLRYDTYEQEAAGNRDVGDSKLSKKLALSYQATDWLMLFGSYAEAFRAPSLTELYVSGTHFVFNTFVPNPDLTPEFAKNKEVGAALSFDDVVEERDALRIKGAVFQNDVEDLIEQSVQGGAFGTTTTSNVPEARIRGAELEIQYEGPMFFSGLSATRMRGDDLTQGDALADIPEDLVTLTAGLRFADLGLTTGWRSMLFFGQDRTSSTGTAHPGKKMVHDLFVSYTPNDPQLDGLRVDFGIDNIFDNTYRRYPSELNETGRNAKLTASLQF